MLPGMCSPNLGLNIVDGVRALNPKGGGPVGLLASCPGKELVGGLASRLGKACCRAWPCLPLAACYLKRLFSYSFVPVLRPTVLLSLPTPVVGMAATVRAQVRGTEVPILLYTDKHVHHIFFSFVAWTFGLLDGSKQ